MLLLCMAQTSHAVLKEADLENTLTILRQEMTNYYQDQKVQAESSKQMRQLVFTELMSIVRRSNQNALMLYSQKPDYVFDLTYACHEATEMYQSFKRSLLPFRNIVNKYENEIARYDSLVTSLNTMSTRMLSEKAAIDRTVCLALAVNIKRTLEENRQSMSDYIRYYHDTEERLKNLNDYASKRYYEIQSNIFINGGDNYFKILSQLGARLSQTKEAVAAKYEPYQRVHSQWDSRVIIFLFLSMLGYALLAGNLYYGTDGIIYLTEIKPLQPVSGIGPLPNWIAPDGSRWEEMPDTLSAIGVRTVLPYTADVYIFDALSVYVNNFEQKFGYNGEMEDPKRDSPDGQSKLGFLYWDEHSKEGRKAGTGVYIWRIFFKFDDGHKEAITVKTGIKRNNGI